MWDDKINKKIKDAADQYHPAYDESAWDKMEVLLNDHLPVENKKRKKYPFIFIISLLAGASFFFIYKQTSSTSKNSEKTEIKNNVAASSIPKQKSLTNNEGIAKQPANVANTTSSQSDDKNLNQLLKNFAGKATGSNTNKASITTTGNKPLNSYGKTNSIIMPGDVENANGVLNNSVENSVADQQKNIEKQDVSSEKITTVTTAPDIKGEIAQAKKDSANSKEVVKNNNAKEIVSGKRPTITNKSFANNFAIDFSLGPDISGVGFIKTGQVAINHGIGLGYTLSRRFTLRSGFYISQKIYSADKSEYHISGGGTNVNYLYNIDANCKVYEIPVTVSYNFGKVKNHQWFASAGLSSYIMKKESYVYYYKYPNNYQDSKSWSISNQNQNYFSVLDLSAGYEYSFNKKSSLLVEPYIKMPLSGVGAGKVKLNSGGILFTYILKPFYKNK